MLRWTTMAMAVAGSRAFLRAPVACHSHLPRDDGTYPGLDDSEIIALLDKVPVFSLVDEAGNAAVVQQDDGTASLEFFLDARYAMTRRARMEGGETLRLMGQSLGRVLVAYDADDAPLPARVLADPKELSAARQVVLRGVDPVAAATNMTFQELEAAYLLADPDRRFAAHTDVPLFSVAQLVLAKSNQVPWFFSMADCVEQWRVACGEDIASYQNGELRLVSLSEMLDKLRAPSSDGDGRDRFFVPSKTALAAVGVNVQ